ncbi:MAG TPA: 1-acyl-sn-glycerol-3-phosphate acyltransferase [Pseudomonadales bacterium]
MATDTRLTARQDAYYWRLFATGLSFFNFGLGGLLLRFVVFPLVFVLPLARSRKVQINRQLVHLSYRLFVWQMKALGVLSYEVHGRQHLRPGQLVIANHPTLIDVAFLLSFIPGANCIVRHGLFDNVFTRGPVRGAAYIPNRNPEQLIGDCVASLQAGETLIIFPEGTRTVPGEQPRFQRGAANIALAAAAEVVPVRIKCSENTLAKGQKWYDIPRRRPHWTLEVGPPMRLPPLEPSPKAVRRISRMFYDYFFPQESELCH